MSNSAPQAGGVLAWAWRPGALLYLVGLLAALAAGLWADAVFPLRSGTGRATLPTLKALAVAQAAFILLIHPLVLARRAARAGGGAYWCACAVESGVMLAVAVPFYAAAGWLADAVWTDCLRLAIAVAMLWPVAWSAGRAMAGGRVPSAALVVLWTAAVGLPWAYYVAREFVPSWSGAGVLWLLGPVTFVWDAAASRGQTWWPQPIWPILVWLAFAAALGLLATRGHGKRAGDRL